MTEYIIGGGFTALICLIAFIKGYQFGLDHGRRNVVIRPLDDLGDKLKRSTGEVYVPSEDKLRTMSGDQETYFE